jgi:hypothetical protein
MKATSRAPGARASAAGSALTVAVCAAFGTGPAEAIPSITLYNQPLNGPLTIDLNHDGHADLIFAYLPTANENDLDTLSNYAVGYQNPFGPKPGTYANKLQGLTLIDGSLQYVQGQQLILKGSTLFAGNYGEFWGDEGYAGFKVNFPGESGWHYGWALLRDPPDNLTLVEIGFETDQNTGIVTPSLAPEPGTLALLAAGAAGVLAMRRRQRST